MLAQRLAQVAYVTFLLASASGAANAAQTHEVKIGDRTFVIPDGFSIERVAGSPLVDRPIVADFDERGRLYVADSSGSNDKVENQLANPTHRIVRLEDLDGNGTFDRSSVFADKMMFPEGTLWHEGSLYVSAPPSIWKLTDTNDDGVADSREEWFQGKTLTGCANDLHGPYLGLDGWIYWCKGAFAKQTYDRPGKTPFETRASHIFRRRPSGGPIEPVMTGGMDNPVDVAFTLGGERIFTTTFLVHPGGGQRDGLIHAIYGGVYGKVHDVIDGHPRTSSDVMPVLVHLGPAAPCGLTRFESDSFGPEYQNNLFATLFNLRKVTRHILTESGATFDAKTEDFVTSGDQDFHPTDIQEDADGSLLIVDTGGWYKLCCPTSQLVKPDILGGIYRVRKIGSARIEDPRGLKLDWSTFSCEQLSRLLDDHRPAVRKRAITALAKNGDSALGPLAKVVEKSPSAEARRNAVWTLTRIDGEAARSLVRKALNDSDSLVRQAALHSIGVLRDSNSAKQVVGLLKSPSAHNRRAAAEALGRIGDRATVPALLEAAGETNERTLEHSLIFALIEIGDPKATSVGLRDGSPGTRRAAMIALDQMPDGHLGANEVVGDLGSPDPLTRQTADWIAGRHPEWSELLARSFQKRIDSIATQSDQERGELERRLSQFASSAPIGALLTRALEPLAPKPTRNLALRAIANSGIKQTPTEWAAALRRILAEGEPESKKLAIAAVRGIALSEEQVEPIRQALLDLAMHDELSAELRLSALAAIPGNMTTLSPQIDRFLLAQLDPDLAVATRALAADIVSKAAYDNMKLLELADRLRTLAPFETIRLLEAFRQSTDAKVGLALIESLEASSSRSSLRTEVLEPILKAYPAQVHDRAKKLYQLLDADLGAQRIKLEKLLSSLDQGDIRKGQAVFNGTRGGCTSCHAIGYVGGKIGPDLTRIGQIRNDRDLLEAIVFPSAGFVRSYEPIAVATIDGKITSGLLKKESTDEVILVTGANQEVRIERSRIEEIKPGTVSIMPSGFDQQLSTRELADLLAFLKACR